MMHCRSGEGMRKVVTQITKWMGTKLSFYSKLQKLRAPSVNQERQSREEPIKTSKSRALQVMHKHQRAMALHLPDSREVLPF